VENLAFHEPSSPSSADVIIEGLLHGRYALHVAIGSAVLYRVHVLYLRLGKVNIRAWRCLQLANEVVEQLEKEAGIGRLIEVCPI